MKSLSQEEIRDLARVVLATKPDELICDEWLEHAPRYAELVAEGAPVPEALVEAAQHLDLCPECAEELRACLLALAAR
ncbi:hypothetical protein [Sorangium sp. So ce145]|uniref:hypothetical protein n=1 Tax=Sorangium sp. So ce145 TaxID=3133285 RepID=UPI003F63E527